MRKRFSLGSHGHYTSFQMCERAMAAEAINTMLDEGKRVFGRLSPDKDEWAEIEEALEPLDWSISCKMKDGTVREIHGYDGTGKRA